ncbi:hypothetical protein [Winogradskyella sp.]|uniref:phage head spike fiber domain-containing protein n=1 Tax=Winogradskyella sp. TaxID=1883156 RepID=UPI0035198E3A
MKRIITIICVCILASCQKSKDKKQEYVGPEVVETMKEKEAVLDTVTLLNSDKWILKNASIDSTSAIGQSTIKRVEANQPSYTMIFNIPVMEGSKYRVSVLAKKGSEKYFGLRLTSKYPNRTDAVFNLETGKVNGSHALGDFENEKATIESTSDGWYKCTLTTEVFTDRMSIILGSTDNEKLITNWESGTTSLNEVTIKPSSILLEEISL